MNRVPAVLVTWLLLGCASAGRIAETDAVSRVLDSWHRAAAAADEASYFRFFNNRAVFLGTDATERWTTESFRTFAHPYFERGKAWTFVPRSREVQFSADGQVAWFDELLDSQSYGVCRGSGVLQKVAGEWKIEQYNLSIPIPNSLAKEFVEKIRAANP